MDRTSSSCGDTHLLLVIKYVLSFSLAIFSMTEIVALLLLLACMRGARKFCQRGPTQLFS